MQKVEQSEFMNYFFVENITMKPYTILIYVLSAVLLQSCATKKNWYATGGDRAGGTVELSYEVLHALEIPEVSEQEAIDIAIRRCQGWGYSGAEAFEALNKTCVSRECRRYIVTREFQCLDNLEK